MNDSIRLRLIEPDDVEWPAALADLGEDMPKQLWLRGEADLTTLLTNAVAIVGARAATAYGSDVASRMGNGLASKGYTVVSGGAYGIDAMAHWGALSGTEPTIAVLATGVDVAYPKAHDRLFERIATEGLLVSEYEPGASPRPNRFLARNRIVAALTKGTVVVEAGLRSGSLNTARRAKEMGRLVMAVPGPVTSAMSVGCHALIKDGALLVTDHDDVIAALEA